MLTLTRDVVGRIARALITLEGETTTLDVKNKLRELGFFAKQADVRNFMLDITSNDGDIVYRDSGEGYRVYTFVVPFPDADDDMDDDVQNDLPSHITVKASDIISGVMIPASPHNSTIITTKPTIPQGMLKLHRDLVPADYEVTDRSGAYPRTYFRVNRHQARSMWSQDTGMHYFHARTRKLT